MTYKSMPAGNLIDYVQSKKDYKGLDRTSLPTWFGPKPELTEDFLRRLSPPHVKSDRRRRWVGHCRQHLTHLLIGFSESSDQVAPFRRIAIRTLECLVAAGLPLDSLQFVWCEHKLPKNSHLHGGLVRSLLPDGGAYNPALSGALAIDCSWLVSRRLGLSLPTGRTRLIRGGEFSYKPVHRERLDKISSKTQEKYLGDQLKTHGDFLELLQGELAQTVLAAPGPDGLPEMWTNRPIGRHYRQCVAVAGPDDSVVWLAGLVCRQSFTAEAADQDQQRRRKKFREASTIYRRFLKHLKARIVEQQQRYPVRTGQPAVTQGAFLWLNPEADARYLAPDSLELHARELADTVELPEPVEPTPPPVIALRDLLDPDAPAIPEAAYPFYSDLREENLQITDPRSLYADDLDEPIEQNAWVPFVFNLRDSDPGGERGMRTPVAEQPQETKPSRLALSSQAPQDSLAAQKERLRRLRCAQRKLRLRIAISVAMGCEARRKGFGREAMKIDPPTSDLN